jgi:hypothetical protein
MFSSSYTVTNIIVVLLGVAAQAYWWGGVGGSLGLAVRMGNT